MGCGASTQAAAPVAAAQSPAKVEPKKEEKPAAEPKADLTAPADPSKDTLKGAVQCRVFTGDASKGTLAFPELSEGPFCIPALKQKPNFGIALSGGRINMHATMCINYTPAAPCSSAPPVSPRRHATCIPTCLRHPMLSTSLWRVGHPFFAGGMRATTTSLGAVRALNDLGLLKKSRYISSTSGEFCAAGILLPFHVRGR